MANLLQGSNIIIIIIVLGVSLFILSNSADLLVDDAVKLSKIWGLPEMVIGATIVSLGTTLPELSASVTSTLQGNGNFALGNAVGSIITNTSLIIGIGAMFGKIPVDRKSSQKVNLLIIAVFLLIVPTFAYKTNEVSGRIPQWMGYVFITLIPIYVYYLIKQEKNNNHNSDHNNNNNQNQSGNQTKNSNQNKNNNFVIEKGVVSVGKKKESIIPIILIVLKIALAAFLIAVSSNGLVSSAEVLAVRIGIPDVVIASTLVAFGTSVPELSTCITAAKKNHGGLALGNIMGANILNILMVVGVSVTLSSGEITVIQEFYKVHFIALGIIVSFFGYFAYNSKYDQISKKEGIQLILIYFAYIVANLFISM